MGDGNVGRLLNKETDEDCDECCHDDQEDQEGGTSKHPSSNKADDQAEKTDNGGIEKGPPASDG